LSVSRTASSYADPGPDTHLPWIGGYRGRRRRPGPYTTRSGKARVTAAVRLET
jgi:hypothetical protein